MESVAVGMKIWLIKRKVINGQEKEGRWKYRTVWSTTSYRFMCRTGALHYSSDVAVKKDIRDETTEIRIKAA